LASLLYCCPVIAKGNHHDIIVEILRKVYKYGQPLDLFDIGGNVDSGDVEIISWDISDDFSVSMM
jgi:hypothetical protein